ncbi:DegT/DnrJ/EryC1/StrS family aminotransferase, partial [bacterium]|nr:DegT/DnrJ/EryC1/StrS family aminotransferase [bacterium]
MKDFILFGQPEIGDEEAKEVLDSLKKGWLGTGPKTKRFEENFAKYKSVKHSLALNSCTAGLHLSCLSLELNPGDEVITTAMTFCATINTIIHAGGKPVLVDIEPNTWNIDPTKLEEKITSKTKAIIPVHFAGRPCDMDEIICISNQYNLKVIEDCAHAIETVYKGKQAGAIGDMGVFSFYATKNLAVGEGGMIISDNENLISRLKILALHGMSKDAWSRFADDGYKHYKVEAAGFKYNMPDIQAAIGIHQLKRIEEFSIKRERIWNLYLREFNNLPIKLPCEVEDHTKHAYHLFNICLDESKTGIKRDVFLN